MPKRKKDPRELTTEEAIKRLFPKRLIKKAREDAGLPPEFKGEEPHSKDQGTTE